MDLSLIDLLLVFGVAFIVPLNLGRLRREGVRVPGAPAIAGSSFFAVASFVLPSGIPAAVLTGPWLILCSWIAAHAALRLLSERRLDPVHLLPAAALVYLLVGATWLSIFRLGVQPLGLSSSIVELTAVHFHFAGFGAPLFALATARLLQDRWPRRAAGARVAGLGVVAAMPVVAAGFFAPPVVAGCGALLLAASLWALAGLMFPAARTLVGAPRILLTIAGVAVVVPMALALEYAGGPMFGLPVLSIPEMARFHGAANAFGFSACATLALLLNERMSVAA